MLNIVSLLSNTLVFISVYRNTSLRTTTNIYIVALAISDLLSAIFVVPLAASVHISGTWPFGQTVCEMHAFFLLFTVVTSPVTMGFTAVNRYVRMCKSEQQYKTVLHEMEIKHNSCFCVDFCNRLHMGDAPYRFTGFYFNSGYATCSNENSNNSAMIIHYLVVIGLFFVLPLAIAGLHMTSLKFKLQKY